VFSFNLRNVLATESFMPGANTSSQQNVLFLSECTGKENAETIENNG
jgi:hypothetical protein